MNENEIVKEWITKADQDFGFASMNLKEAENYFAQICFHFQQAAEKYLKAYIIAKHLQFRPIHNLIELLNICKASDETAQEMAESCQYLNPIYIDTRYPVHWPTSYDKQTAIEAKHSAEIIRKWVRNALQRDSYLKDLKSDATHEHKKQSGSDE